MRDRASASWSDSPQISLGKQSVTRADCQDRDRVSAEHLGDVSAMPGTRHAPPSTERSSVWARQATAQRVKGPTGEVFDMADIGMAAFST